MLFHLIFATFCLSPAVIDSFIVHVSVEHRKTTGAVHPHGTMSCVCNGKSEVKQLPKGALVKVFESIQKQDFCGEKYASDTCRTLKTCSNCTAEVVSCNPSGHATKSYVCYTKKLEMREKYMINTYGAKEAPKLVLSPNSKLNSLDHDHDETHGKKSAKG